LRAHHTVVATTAQSMLTSCEWWQVAGTTRFGFDAIVRPNWPGNYTGGQWQRRNRSEFRSDGKLQESSMERNYTHPSRRRLIIQDVLLDSCVWHPPYTVCDQRQFDSMTNSTHRT
jgi:hypothetical protein